MVVAGIVVVAGGMVVVVVDATVVLTGTVELTTAAGGAEVELMGAAVVDGAVEVSEPVRSNQTRSMSPEK